ncbi:ABC transporter permease [Pleionea sediminis]|uniref:ABC transporter permease n=1 Tax=Pleionea sediminis TaxID=2569479 RepID=UPI0011861A13|nr:ABC transporter permease [Pleionea sediminis]
MMLITLIKVELLKTKRSLSLLMMIVCPLMVVLLQTMVLVKTGLGPIEKKGWISLWMTANALWSYFMFPLFLALITALLNGNEHKNDTWRFMLTQPVSQFKLYIAKLILAFVYCFAANVMLYIWLGFSILLLHLFGVSDGLNITFDLSEFKIFKSLTFSLVSCLPVLIIQHAISWRFSNIVVPLAVGVIATMGIIQIGSSEYWVYHPWSYITMATVGSQSDMQLQAVIYSIVIASILFIGSSYWFTKKSSVVY